jgi:hypothetical protein
MMSVFFARSHARSSAARPARPLVAPLAALTLGVTLLTGLPALSATAAAPAAGGTGITAVETPGISAGIPVPTAANTGVPVGTNLTVHEGDLKITVPGTVIDGYDIRGVVFVTAPDVTIRNSIVRGRAVTVNTGLINALSPAVKNLYIDSVELAPTTPSVFLTGLYGHDLTIRRSNIHHVVDGIHLVGDNVRVYRNWVHDLSYFAVDPAQRNGPTHNDDVQIQKGANIWIKDNVLTGANNAAIQVTQDQGPVTSLGIENNLISGGGCSVNVAEKGKGAITRLLLTDNTFGASTYNCNAIIDSATRSHPTTTIANNNRTDNKATTIITR